MSRADPVSIELQYVSGFKETRGDFIETQNIPSSIKFSFVITRKLYFS